MPYYRRRYYKRKGFYPRRRYWFFNRRSRKTFRKRRRNRVRRKRFYRRRFRKLKTLKQIQYQPEQIKKCRIKGYLELFDCGYGRQSDNYALFKESTVPPHQPGGGGWSIQQLTLGNLYVQGKYAMNYWTRSNKGFNLCRFLGVQITLFRMPDTDYIFHYDLEDPQIVTKYTYPSYHPYKMLLFNKKIVVPSLKTAPHKRKQYKKKFIRPPKKLKNEWYFQEHLSNYPLLTFFATACDLAYLFASDKAKNNNVSLNVLNTRFITHPNFQTTTGTSGWSPDNSNYVYAFQKPPTLWPSDGTPLKEFVFLGDPKILYAGQPMLGSAATIRWGNIFDPENLHLEAALTVQNIPVSTAATSETKIKKEALKTEPLYFEVRYNPNKDDGDGNEVYFVQNFNAQLRNWDPPTDQDLILRGHPLWLMLWGLQSYIQKTGKFNNLDKNGILVIRTKFFEPEKLGAYVVLSDSFINGQGPYEQDQDEITNFNRQNWYPRWLFQKEPIENLLISGPAVKKSFPNSNIQAYMKYNFFFKWGGNPSKMETIADPNQQPTGPDPTNIFSTNEIIDPQHSIADYIYKWDVRRDLLTQTATKRITEIPILKPIMFTDGQQTSTDPPIQKTWTPQEETTTEKEKETLLQQFQLLQQHNTQLEQRLRQLTTILDE
nr:MAG: ORF1 [TTV-like mini virus]